MTKKIILIVFVFFEAFTVSAQNYQTVEEVEDVCAQLGFTSDEEAQLAVDKILNEIGIPTKSFKLRSCPNINNAIAKNIKDANGNFERYILYDINFMKRISDNAQNDWSAISVLAHEIGHHLSGHSLNNKGSNHKWELEADYFSGVALAKMGASLGEAQSAIQTLRYEKATSTHPAKADRLVEIEKGWTLAGGENLIIKDINTFYTFTQKNILEYKNKPDDAIIPAPSPYCIYAKQLGANTKITIKYSRPSIRGRKIFGDLYPYGEIWRTGANSNTIIDFSNDILIDSNILKSGSYAIYTVPSKDYWTVLFYTETNSFGTPHSWDNNKVALSIKIKPEVLPDKMETFNISVDVISELDALLNLSYENIKVRIPISEISKESKSTLVTSIFQVVGLTQFEVLYYNILKLKKNKPITIIEELKFDDDIIIYDKPIKRGSYKLVGFLDTKNLKLELEKKSKSKFNKKNNSNIEIISLNNQNITNKDYLTEVNFENLTNNTAILKISLDDNHTYQLPIKLPTHSKVKSNFESLIAINALTHSKYFSGADYYYSNNYDIDKAKNWIDIAVKESEKEKFWYYHLQSKIYFKYGEINEAITIAKKALKLAKIAGNKYYIKLINANINDWQK